MTDTPSERRADRFALLAMLVAATLAIGSMLIFGAFIVGLFTTPIPKENQQMMSTALGILGGTMIGAAFGFFLGGAVKERRTDPGPGTSGPHIGGAAGGSGGSYILTVGGGGGGGSGGGSGSAGARLGGGSVGGSEQ